MRRFWCLLVAVYHNLLCSCRILRAVRCQKDDVVYTTSNNVEIRVYPGKKKQSPFDFIVRFKESGKRERTPRHVHLIVEMYVKLAYNPTLTMKLRQHSPDVPTHSAHR